LAACWIVNHGSTVAALDKDNKMIKAPVKNARLLNQHQIL